MLHKNTEAEVFKVDPISERIVAGCSVVIKFQEAHCITPSFNFSFTSNDYIQGQ